MISPVALGRLNAAYAGRAVDEAFLELAQEHFLDYLRAQGLADDLVFKGGTSLRKFVFGLQGRFSLDLDFQTSDRGVGELVIEAVEKGFTHQGVTFAGSAIDHGAMKAAWKAATPELGTSRLACRLDLSTRPLLLPAIKRPRMPLPGVDSTLGFVPLDLRIADLRETTAEKLARVRRVLFARDVYDLAFLAPLVRDDLELIRELLLYKVFFDVVDDDRGNAPFNPHTEYQTLQIAQLVGADDIGSLTKRNLDPGALLTTVKGIYGTIKPPTGSREEVLARCNRADRYQVERWQEALQDRFPGNEI